MKKLTLLLFLFSAFAGFSQKISNATITDCNNQTKSIYGVLGTGKVLVVASKGFDCGICMSHAGNFGNFIQQNSNAIEGWGAMVNIYSSAPTTCNQVSNWDNTYGWTNKVFSFLDKNSVFFKGGTPRYYVINPADSSIVYEGPNYNTMVSTALTYANPNLNTNEIQQPKPKVYLNDGVLKIQSLNPIKGSIRVVNLLGQTVLEFNGQNQNEISISTGSYFTKGVYILLYQENGEAKSVRFRI